MNIFILDENPRIAAEYMCDKHVPKMIVETFQMMGSALRRHGATDCQMPLTQAGNPLKGGYHNHPCTVWAGDTRTNFNWLGLHGLNLCNEYTIRYHKRHACHDKIDRMLDIADMIPSGRQTPYAQAMPDEYKDSYAVYAYRNYYFNEKRYFAKWEKGRCAPEWWKEMQLTTQECLV